LKKKAEEEGKTGDETAQLVSDETLENIENNKIQLNLLKSEM
jgi:hypothetical protein